MEQKLLILGGGTAGTMIADTVRKRLPEYDWDVTVIDATPEVHRRKENGQVKRWSGAPENFAKEVPQNAEEAAFDLQSEPDGGVRHLRQAHAPKR